VRILQLSDFYPPVIGGLERHVQVLSHELARRGHDVAVATMRSPGHQAVDDDGPVRVHRLAGASRALARFYEDPARPFHPTVPDPVVVTALRRLLAEFRPDVVHAHGWILYSGLVATRATDTKLVVTLHDHGLECAKKTLFRDGKVCEGPTPGRCLPCASRHYGAAKGVPLTIGLFASRGLHHRVDRYVAISRFVADAARPFTSSRPIDVIPTFMEDGLFDPPNSHPRPSFVPTGEFIMFVGALGPHKGLDVLLEAHRRLDRRLPLLLVGTRDRDRPTALPDGVTAVAEVAAPQVMAAWRRCTVAAVPSRWPEPLGQVALEAMASRRAVVASAVGGLVDVITHGETGLLVPPGDPQALAAAVSLLADDPALRARLGEAARRRAELYRASVVIDRLESVFEQLLNGAPPSSRGGVEPAHA
jgi:glycosyltransferase involved in cell wall biosynthesis